MAKHLRKRILGIDPGTARLGYAVVDYTSHDKAITLVACGVIATSKKDSDAKRLSEIRFDLKSIIEQYQPEVMSIEELFFFKNIKTVIPVAQARGVVMELAATMNLEIFEYTPLQVKQNITGDGRADKNQVAKIIYQLLDIKIPITPDDAVDAVALAITYLRSDFYTRLVPK